MQLIKRKAILMAVVLVVLFIFSSSAYAQEPTPQYVYFEVADGFPTTQKNVIMVNYDKILNPDAYDISEDDHQGLIDSLNLGIRSALSAHKKVWVETEVGGDTIITLYSDALYDGEDYTEAVTNETYHTTRPEVTYEMYYEGGRKFRTPDETEFKPLELPAWLDENYTVVEEKITETWLVTVRIIEDELPEGGMLNENTRLRYVYYDDDNIKQRIYATAKPDTDHTEWLFVIPEDEVDMGNEFVLEPGDLEIRVGLTYYNQ